MSTAAPVAIEVPDIGDFENVPVIEILVSPGDRVAAEDPLLTLESDKATMDVPAPFAGTVRELSVKVGDTVSQGDLLLTIEPSANGRAPAPRASAIASEGVPVEAAAPDAILGALAAEPPPEAEPPPPTPLPPAPAGPEPPAAQPATDGRRDPVYASPSVRKLARELGVDLARVTGTGRKGRITRGDVESLSRGTPAAAGATAGPALPSLAPWPSLDFSKQGPVERVPRTRIQRIAAPNLARNWALIPHVTQHDEADITELEAWRKRLNEQHAGEGVKVTMVSFLVLACVTALKRYPDFNSSLDGDELIVKRYYNIGFAADTPDGLVVPVIKGADGKGLLEIARELTELSGKARAGELGPGDISGATFTISSLGGIGGTAFTPIVNAPEVAILGVSRSAMKPVWNGQEFLPRLMLPLSLSYDHRVIDGAAAARFVVYLGEVLGDLREALL